jgi:hypothetical protein
MELKYLQIIVISLIVTYVALSQHIFREKAVISFIFEHLTPVIIGLLIATLFYIHRYGLKNLF